MFNPIKAVKTEITDTVTIFRIMHTEYKYERMILASQAKLAETKHVPGYTKIYA